MTNYIPLKNLQTHDEPHVRMRQVVEYFNVERRVVLKWVENGLLPALKLDGGEWRFKVADLIALERTLTDRARSA